MAKSVERHGWASTSFDQALVPRPGQRIRQALLTTYSADLPAVVVALCALAGNTGEAGDPSSPGKIALAQTLHQLRDATVRIAVQGGRLRGGTRAPIAALLDRFLWDVPQDERHGSWHAKLALMRFEPTEPTAGGGTTWRFWMGSRNLVSTENAELGLTLDSSSAPDAKAVLGLAGRVKQLAGRCGYTGSQVFALAKELDAIRWHLPPGCTDLSVLHDVHGLPETHTAAQRVIVVSPFLNADTLNTLGRWGVDATHVLVSTRTALGSMSTCASAPLSRFSPLLELAGPEISEADSEGMPQEPAGDAEFTPCRRLHAKLIGVQDLSGSTLYVGSANATQRGWGGGNEELVARMQVTQDLWDGLEHWIDQAQEVDRLGLTEDDPASELQNCLEDERARIASLWQATLFFEPEQTRLVSRQAGLERGDAAILRHVALYTQDQWYPWSGGSSEVALGAAALAEQTGFVRVSLQLEGAATVQWIQCCEVHQGIDAARDGAALGAYLGAAHLLTWWKAMLQNGSFDVDGDAAWNRVEDPARTALDAYVEDAVTLEDMLRGWARSPKQFLAEGMQIREYTDHLKTSGMGTRDLASEQLQHMSRLWDMLTEGTR